MCALREAVAKRLFDQILGNSRAVSRISWNSRLPHRQGGKGALEKQTACWGIELSHLRVDRIELPDTVQAEILKGWKQTLRGPDTSDRAAKDQVLGVLRQFREEQEDFVDLFQVFSRIVRRVREITRPEGMKLLHEGLQAVLLKIASSEEATRKLPEALKNLEL